MKQTIRRMIESNPGIEALLKQSIRPIAMTLFPGSQDYWESRYAQGKTSGPGSYGQLAVYKAEVINAFVAQENIHSVIEFGCGDGAQLSLANYPDYIGLDVSRSVLDLCQQRFTPDSSKKFFLFEPQDFLKVEAKFKAELGLSLDVVYHLIEEEVFDTYLQSLFSASEKFVIIYSSNYDEVPLVPHIRHRKFSDWVDTHQPQWQLLQVIPNRYPFQGDYTTGSFADFYIYQKREG
jgi:hypothetical protein